LIRGLEFNVKKTQSNSVKVGDWVRMYEKGIWQVYRVLVDSHAWDPAEEKPGTKVTIFGKRLVNGSFKRAFSQSCCSIYWVKPLSKADDQKLKKFIATNLGIWQEFVDYRPKPVDTIFNATFTIPDDRCRERIEALIPRDKDFSAHQIGPLLKKLGLPREAFPHWTAQFISRDHNVKRGTIVYRFERVLEF